MLAGERLARAPEASRDLVHAEERPVAAAERLGALEVAGPGSRTPWPTIGSVTNMATSSVRSSASRASRSLNGTDENPGSSGPNASGERRPAVRGQGAERQTVEAVLDGDDAWALRRRRDRS